MSTLGETIRAATDAAGTPVIEVTATQQMDVARARAMLALLKRRIAAEEARLAAMRGRTAALEAALAQTPPAAPVKP
jgi:BMFP domain-containing protein YqiC